MKLIKISSPNIVKKRSSFYNFVKSKNVVIIFFHGTSTRNWELMNESGWMLPPSFRGKQSEEERFRIRTTDFTEEEAITMGGLDKLFFTKDKYYAYGYASRESSLRGRGDPLVLQINVPLHMLDEIKGHIEGKFIYNENKYGKYCAEIIDSSLSNQEKLNKIIDFINNSSGEWTIRGGLKIKREKGFRHVMPEDSPWTDIESTIDYYRENFDYYKFIEDEDLKNDPRIINAYLDGLTNVLRNENPEFEVEKGFENNEKVINSIVSGWIRIIEESGMNVDDLYDYNVSPKIINIIKQLSLR